MSDNALLHVSMKNNECDGRAADGEDEQRENEECGLPASLLRGLGNSERVDEGVGEKVDETHSFIMLCGEFRIELDARTS
jgi:hypothetical protein